MLAAVMSKQPLTATTTRVCDLREVKSRTTLSGPTLWRLRKTGRFPEPVRLSPGRVGWREADLLDWLDTRTAAEKP